MPGSNERRSLPMKFADAAMFEQEKHTNYRPEYGVIPKVHLLSMNADPLGDLAAMVKMYEGKGVTNLGDLTDYDRRWAWNEAMATHLKAPFESIKFHFYIEGCDRAFTHQLVRQRTGAYAQESLRFAVVDDLAVGTTLPPSLYGTHPIGEFEAGADDRLSPEEFRRQEMRNVWDEAMGQVSDAYSTLVDMGMTAEDARGLLPQATATRIHYMTDLRNLSDVAGNRLCTQAQFAWRGIFSQMIQAIKHYPVKANLRIDDTWQFDMIANSNLFRPVCFQQGKCPWKGDLDRKCSIRSRVDEYAQHNIPSSEWEYGVDVGTNVAPYVKGIAPIQTEEWLLDPDAAKKGYKPSQSGA